MFQMIMILKEKLSKYIPEALKEGKHENSLGLNICVYSKRKDYAAKNVVAEYCWTWWNYSSL